MNKFHTCSSVSIVNFEHVIAGWASISLFEYLQHIQPASIQHFSSAVFWGLHIIKNNSKLQPILVSLGTTSKVDFWLVSIDCSKNTKHLSRKKGFEWIFTIFKHYWGNLTNFSQKPKQPKTTYIFQNKTHWNHALEVHRSLRSFDWVLKTPLSPLTNQLKFKKLSFQMFLN